MTRIIAHRANLDLPNISKHLGMKEKILACIDAGFFVELDVRAKEPAHSVIYTDYYRDTLMQIQKFMISHDLYPNTEPLSFEDVYISTKIYEKAYYHAKDIKSAQLLERLTNSRPAETPPHGWCALAPRWFAQDKDKFSIVRAGYPNDSNGFNSYDLQVWINATDRTRPLREELEGYQREGVDLSSAIICLNDYIESDSATLRILNTCSGVCVDRPFLYETLLKAYK